VVTPFDIEEIFPAAPAGSVRLPRRQTGSSPQDLAVTLMADYTLRTRAWVPSAAIVALLGESGISPAGARTAISRLARRDVLESSRDGRRSSYRLTRPAAVHLSVGGGRIAASTAPSPPWEGWWTLVAFSLPNELSVERRALRSQLRWQGYAPLYDALWISPYALTPNATAKLTDHGLGAVTVFRARHVELEASTSRNPIKAWDVAGIAREYESFVSRWSPLLPGIRRGEVGGAEAARARTEVMNTYRRFPVLDPELPVQLLPPRWPRQRVREVFAAVYDGLAEAAQQHVRSIVGGFAEDGQPGIRAHSLADLIAGIGCTVTPRPATRTLT
jgi:phenylacetic acid degradation operon negative regulatory protein